MRDLLVVLITSYSSITFFDQLLKEGLDKLTLEDCEKFLKPIDKKAEFQKLAEEKNESGQTYFDELLDVKLKEFSKTPRVNLDKLLE